MIQIPWTLFPFFYSIYRDYTFFFLKEAMEATEADNCYASIEIALRLFLSRYKKCLWFSHVLNSSGKKAILIISH